MRHYFRPVAVLSALLLLLLALALPVSTALAADDDAPVMIELQDGTLVTGTIHPLSSRTVRIKTDDGRSMLVGKDKIKTVDGMPYETEGPAVDADGKPVEGAAGELRRDWKICKERADRVTEPVTAVDLWERYLGRTDLTQSERDLGLLELQTWRERYQSDAERIRGSWVGGDELREIKNKANELVDEAIGIERINPTDAMRKYGQALAIYPNAFRPHYRLAYVKFHQGNGVEGGNIKLAEAEGHARQALRLQPRLPAVLSSMGACLFVRDKYEEGLEYMLDAVEIAPTELTVGNFLAAIDGIPENFKRANPRIREMSLTGELLREEYSAGQLTWIEDFAHGTDQTNPDDPDNGPPGLRGNGSGFFVTADGYLLTNKHVAETDDGFYYRVRLAGKNEDGTFIEYPARFIASDDAYDIALLKIELPEGETVPYLQVIADDYPPIQSDILTLGYPTTLMDGFNLQVSRGAVTTTDPAGEEAFDIYMDIKGTQGNSGGPVVDKDGHVIGILSAYRKVIDSIIVMAIGPRQIRDFLKDVEGAPDLEYASPDDTTFDPVTLAADTKPMTLLVLIFAGEADELEATKEESEQEGGDAAEGDESEDGDDDGMEGDEGEESPGMPGPDGGDLPPEFQPQP